MAFKAFLKSAALAGAMALASAAASAATVSLTYNGGTSTGTAKITAAPLGVPPVGVTPTLSTPWHVGAYGFNMTDSTLGGLGSFVAWCLDISHYLGTSGPQAYQTTTMPFSSRPVNVGRVQRVFDANYASVISSDATQMKTAAAGFQVALWNALYDTDWLAGSGNFAVQAGTTSTRADAYLLAASAFGGPRAYNLTFLESTGTPIRQHLGTATPVPLPAAGLLLLAALGGLGLARRRRKAA